MENKYYTPRLKEFHSGFEYDVMIPEKQVWSKETFYLNKSHIDLVQYVDIQDEFVKNKIRVKYLDVEDIESFGFKCTGDCGVEKEFQKNYKYGWTVLEMSFDNKIMIDYEWENDTIGHTSTNTLFVGKIKNKSELKKLLIQLEIINE